MGPKSLESTYSIVSGSWTEGQLENPRERQRQLHALYNALQSSAEAILAASPDDSRMVSQITLTLTSIRALLSSLSPSHLLAAERAVKNSGASDPSRLKPAGLTVVVAEKWAPLTTTIMPVAAALAAGCPSLVILPLGHQIDDKIWELITKQILYKAIDDGGFGVASYSDAHDSFHDGDACQFGAVVSQGTAAADKIVQQLARSQSRSLRILEPCRGGTAAAIVSRSYESSLQAVATEIVDIFNFAFQDGEFNILRFPRVILVDEFVVDKFIEKLEKASSGRPSGGNKKVSTGKLAVIRLQGISGNFVSVKETKAAVSSLSENDNSVFVVSTTSLDDSIDHLNALNSPAEGPIAFIFAACDEASYLSQFINAQQHIIGNIPEITQLINPPADRFNSSKESDSFSFENTYLGLLYSIDQFSRYRPVFNCAKSRVVSPSPGKLFRLSQALPNEVTRRLDPINQSKGGHVSYFSQGLIVSIALIVLPGIGMAGFGVWKLACRLLW